MIAHAGTVWTDENETHEYFERFVELFGPEIGKPECAYCGKTTCYIVEETRLFEKANLETGKKELAAKPLRAGVTSLAPAFSIFPHQDQLFVAMKVCGPCYAQRSGYQCGLRGDLCEKAELEASATSSCTGVELPAWKAAFNNGFYAGLKKREELLAKGGKNPSRYTPKKKEQLI